VSSADLIELSDLNFAEANREFARRAGGTVHDEDGLLLWAGAHPLPVLANGVLRTAPRMSAREDLQRAHAFFARCQRGFTVIVRAHADDDLRDWVVENALTEMGVMPAMILDRRLADAVPPPGVTLRRVETPEDLRAFAHVMGSAYATYGMPADVTPALFPDLTCVAAPHMLSFLACVDDGTPAAGAMTVVTHGVAGIYWVGTTPEARGRGLAEFCTRAAGNAGFDLGARIASLQASVMGEPVYRRMGYVEITRYPYYVQFRPPE
jgi:ribosomal protein S18 acetylase RimI-like enzyme